MAAPARPAATPRPHRPWTPKHVRVTRAAQEHAHAAEIVRRCEALGCDDIELLTVDRITGVKGETERETYARAKATLAVVVSPDSARKLDPIPPSADWRVDLARGCPAHCQYCYLAGSLTGPPITRVYADLDRVLANLDGYVGQGHVTSTSRARAHEGTTFEASCYTDPLGIEPATGSLAAAITHVGTHDWPGPVQLRATTKFAEVGPLLDLPHHGRTRLRFSLSPWPRYEGGTDPVGARIAALGTLASAGWPVGVTLAPIMAPDHSSEHSDRGWEVAYDALLADVAAAVPPDADLTVECITHRFTPGSRETLETWYPASRLEMDPSSRTEKRGKFGAVKHVYPKELMARLRETITGQIDEHLPHARVLYWT